MRLTSPGRADALHQVPPSRPLTPSSLRPSCPRPTLPPFPTRRSPDPAQQRFNYLREPLPPATAEPEQPWQVPIQLREIGRDTSELQSHVNLVCRLLLEKKKKTPKENGPSSGNSNIR